MNSRGVAPFAADLAPMCPIRARVNVRARLRVRVCLAALSSPTRARVRPGQFFTYSTQYVALSTSQNKPKTASETLSCRPLFLPTLCYHSPKTASERKRDNISALLDSGALSRLVCPSFFARNHLNKICVTPRRPDVTRAAYPDRSYQIWIERLSKV